MHFAAISTSHITVAIIAFCALWYVKQTLAPIIFHDRPCQTARRPCQPQLPVTWRNYFAITCAYCVVKAVAEAFPTNQQEKVLFTEHDLHVRGLTNELSPDICRVALCRTFYLIEDHGVKYPWDSMSPRTYVSSTLSSQRGTSGSCGTSRSNCFSQAISMEHSLAISAGDHEWPFRTSSSSKSQGALLHPRSNPQ